MALDDWAGFSKKQPKFCDQLSELWSFAELGSLLPASPILMSAPRGDVHPILVIPGLFADDGATMILRRYLQMLGYKAHPWKLGYNPGPCRHTEKLLLARLDELHARYGQKVSLVGWSMGGVFARELAKDRPDAVRQVITLGSPFRAGYRSDGRMDEELAERLREAPASVPCTAVYSRADGIVPWSACREDPSETTDNIEVPASHFGLAVSPLVLWIVADRLALPEDEWSPFESEGLMPLLYATTR